MSVQSVNTNNVLLFFFIQVMHHNLIDLAQELDSLFCHLYILMFFIISIHTLIYIIAF